MLSDEGTDGRSSVGSDDLVVAFPARAAFFAWRGAFAAGAAAFAVTTVGVVGAPLMGVPLVAAAAGAAAFAALAFTAGFFELTVLIAFRGVLAAAFLSAVFLIGAAALRLALIALLVFLGLAFFALGAALTGLSALARFDATRDAAFLEAAAVFFGAAFFAGVLRVADAAGRAVFFRLAARDDAEAPFARAALAARADAGLRAAVVALRVAFVRAFFRFAIRLASNETRQPLRPRSSLTVSLKCRSIYRLAQS